MKKNITIFLPFNGDDYVLKMIEEFERTELIEKIFLFCRPGITNIPQNIDSIITDNIFSNRTMKAIYNSSYTDFILFITSKTPLKLEKYALERFVSISNDTAAGIVYSDYSEIKSGKRTPHPLIDYQAGSIRDDFEFGSAVLIRKEALSNTIDLNNKDYTHAGFYNLRLQISQHYPIIRIPEFLYSIAEDNTRRTYNNNFAYVDIKNRDIQIEMELAATEHLKQINAYLAPEFKHVNLNSGNFEFEASVIIPVKDRVKTIGDAVNSARKQETNFLFNIIIVDNHSTDGTSEILKKLAKEDNRIIIITPESCDLGIGGCWNEAVLHANCGRYSIQLDSDDIYSDENTLQKIVDCFRRENCAMVIGSYKITDFNLNEIPPGVIDHKEWTDDNGRNNALRINGLGAPRAFFTTLIRETKFPDVSYGEDYNVALVLSRNYQIGRIFEPIYICRRWEGNSDAKLTVEKRNAYNSYKDKLRTFEILARQKICAGGLTTLEKILYSDEEIHSYGSQNDFGSAAKILLENQKKEWDEFAAGYNSLNKVRLRTFNFDGFEIKVQYNPARIKSTAAKVDEYTLKSRECFLCFKNLPVKQKGILFDDDYLILGNPYPIFPEHFTIVNTLHTPQHIKEVFYRLLSLSRGMSKYYTVFYNGPQCGASAPDHLHFQAGNKYFMPIDKDFPLIKEKYGKILINKNEFIAAAVDDGIRKFISFEGKTANSITKSFNCLYNILSSLEKGNFEPKMNILTFYEQEIGWRIIIFLRNKHRPSHYYAEGDKNILLSPAAVDLGGVCITPKEKDFSKITKDHLVEIFSEVNIDKEKFELVKFNLKEELDG